MKEEHVKDEHETTTLSDGTEEAVQDTGGHEALKGSCCCTPRCGSSSKDEEVEQHWESTCPSRESNDKDTASTKHEDIADLRMIDSILAHVPHAEWVRS